MKVLVIPEDPTLDQHILGPIVERLFADLGRPARIRVLQDPHMRGVDEALAPSTVRGIVERYAMMDLFLLMVDRDGDRLGNSAKAAEREREYPGKLIACLAVEEVEVWMLALHKAKLAARWKDVQTHHDPKERYADPFLRAQGWLSLAGRGRKRAMRDLSGQWQSLLALCPELAALRQRVDGWLRERGTAG